MIGLKIVHDEVHPLEPGLSVVKGLEFLSDPVSSCRNATMCESLSDFLPSKITTTVKCGSGRVRK